ncbi:MAG: hypothetical protein ACKVQK_09450 [Burkholderiales bacterium]
MSDIEQARSLLREQGYQRLAEDDCEAAAAALRDARELAAKIPRDILPAEEPAPASRPEP